MRDEDICEVPCVVQLLAHSVEELQATHLVTWHRGEMESWWLGGMVTVPMGCRLLTFCRPGSSAMSLSVTGTLACK